MQQFVTILIDETLSHLGQSFVKLLWQSHLCQMTFVPNGCLFQDPNTTIAKGPATSLAAGFDLVLTLG